MGMRTWPLAITVKLFLLLGSSLICLLLLVCGCGFAWEGLDYEEDLTADYAVWAIDSSHTDTMLVKKVGGSGGSGVVWPMVFAYGWNEDFIIVKQHPEIDHWGHIDTTTTNWFIIRVKTGEVYGPLTEPEYIELRRKLGIPRELDFSRTIEYRLK